MCDATATACRVGQVIPSLKELGVPLPSLRTVLATFLSTRLSSKVVVDSFQSNERH